MSKKTIVLGVTGSIAAFKAAELCGMLVKESFDVVVIMTDSAQKLVTKNTFLTMSRNSVITDLWEVPDWEPAHVALADKASLLVVAPATANIIGKMAAGIADDALSTYALSHDKPVIVAPAMNTKMWRNPVVRRNCDTLRGLGVRFVGPASGMLACGAEGEGRMTDLRDIMAEIKGALG